MEPFVPSFVLCAWVDGASMPIAVNIEKHWRSLAANARAQAAPMSDPLMRSAMLQIAEAYDRLADRARALSAKKPTWLD
jgi:hypothetical protein